MKTSTINKLLATTVLTSVVAFIFLNGCSGGGGGTTTVDSTLDEASVQKLAQNILEEGDCVAISGVQSRLFSDPESSSTLENAQETNLRAYDLDSSVYGLLSGSLRKHGEHNNGTNTLTYDFNNFTNPSGDMKFGVNGSASVIDHGTPGDYGPIMSNKTIDTNGVINVSKSSYSRAINADYEVQLSGYNQIYARVLFSQDDLVISSASAKNTSTNAEYKINDFSAKGWFADDEIALTNVKTTYTDPEVGSLDVTSDVLVISRDSVQLPSSLDGSFTLTATDGTKAEAVITRSGNVKIYTVGSSKILISELDCSGLVH